MEIRRSTEADGYPVNKLQVSKRNIRKQVAERRKGLSPERVSELSGLVSARVMELDEWKAAQRIFIYMSFGAEAETGALIRAAWREGKIVAVPRCEGKEMRFYPIRDFSGLVSGPFGILEPGPECTREIVPDNKGEESLMIMPGVAFDGMKHRIGYGGGYYDRYLEKYPRVRTLAVGFEFQIFEELPWEPTDICPQGIVTEARVIRE